LVRTPSHLPISSSCPFASYRYLSWSEAPPQRSDRAAPAPVYTTTSFLSSRWSSAARSRRP
jgi:hypothetical protein